MASKCSDRSQFAYWNRRLRGEGLDPIRGREVINARRIRDQKRAQAQADADRAWAQRVRAATG